jgi:TPR repeat protein
MKQRITTLFTGGFLALVLFGVAAAGPLADGDAAFHRGDYAAAMRFLRPLADQGNAAAQSNLGVMYGNGLGVPQDYAQAILWFRKAADQGDADAEDNLALMYGYDLGDYAQAAMWYRKAADQGNALGQAQLGALYADGKGVPQDFALALLWFDLAASRADDAEIRKFAVKNRDEVAAKMTPAQIAEAQRLAREWVPK